MQPVSTTFKNQTLKWKVGEVITPLIVVIRCGFILVVCGGVCSGFSSGFGSTDARTAGLLDDFFHFLDSGFTLRGSGQRGRSCGGRHVELIG